MSDITVEGNKLNPDTYIELFDFDMSVIGGAVVYFTNTPTGGGSNPIYWRGNGYYPLPFELSNVDAKADGTAPSRASLALSAINSFALAAVLSLGNLEGMRVTRWRTFYKFLDSTNVPTPSSPNTMMHYPIQTWIVTRKIAQSETGIQLEIPNPLDRPGVKLPRKQILRDFGFPGVGRIHA